MPKFLDDPFKKVSYSFRIEERLLENVKLFANATGRKLPETFNYLIRESLKDCNLDNTYLNDFEGSIINVTFITPATNEYGEIMEGFIDRGNTNYLNLDNEGFLYEVKKIPNNLDTWHDKGGYYSDSVNLLHEGVSILFVPEIQKTPFFEINPYYLHDFLKFIYFSINSTGDLEVKNISYKEAFRRLKEAGNNDTLYNFKNIHKIFWDFCKDFIKEYSTPERDPKASEKLLQIQLLEFANKYNDVNINSLDNMKPTLNLGSVKTSTNYETPETDLNKIIEDLQSQIDQKDKIIKEIREEQENFKTILNSADSTLKRLEELENKKEETPKKRKRKPKRLLDND